MKHIFIDNIVLNCLFDTDSKS